MSSSNHAARPRYSVIAAILLVVVLAAIVFSQVRGSRDDTAAVPRASPDPTATMVAPSAERVAEGVPEAGPGEPDETAQEPAADGVGERTREADALAQAVDVEPAQLGTFVVAKPGAGIVRDVASLGPGAPLLDLPVYDQPFGQPRSLVDVNAVDGIDRPVALTNFVEQEGALVLRVIAGGPDDEWIRVQAPSRPHDRYVWVRAQDFDFGFSLHRIEIDLAGAGQLTLFEANEVAATFWIVQGRDSRPTPTHVTFIESGVEGAAVSPAYGSAILSMASYSEVLGSFGGQDKIPSNYVHGTNQPELVGQRLSSGSIRLTDEAIDFLVSRIQPGTPVLMFDSDKPGQGRTDILARQLEPATTIPFPDGGEAIRESTAVGFPKLWGLCDGDSRPTCLNQQSRAAVQSAYPSDGEHGFVVAKPQAGINMTVTIDEHDAREVRVIPVFDSPGGEARTMIYRNAVDGTSVDYPLMAETVFGQPLVLQVLQGNANSPWLLVRAPVLPHNQAVWVQASHFDFATTSVHIEVDIGYEVAGKFGIMTVWDDGGEVMAAGISSGREARPTTLTSTYVDQIIGGSTLSPAYGPSLISTPSYSETLGTFGGGGMPQQAIHGVPSEILELGVPTSSGSIHVSFETVERLLQVEGLIGAPVYIFDSSQPGGSLNAIRNTRTVPAETRPQSESALVAPIPSFT